jgi:hypothetical protein
MSNRTIVLLVVIGSVAMVATALLIRDGMQAIGHAIRDKPLPAIPDRITLGQVTIEQVEVITEGSAAAQIKPHLNVTIQNMRLGLDQLKALTPAKPQDAPKPAE